MLTEFEVELYKRQIAITGWGPETQEKLKRAKVFVAGAGGLGSAALSYLSVAGVGILKVCDHDQLELSNLNRQILHAHQNIGMNKVDSAFETLSQLNPCIRVKKVTEKITETNVEQLVDDADLIVDCLDKHEPRHLLNRVSLKSRIPMIHAGVSQFHGQMTFLHPPETPCLRCFFPIESPSIENPILGCTPGVMGSLEALEAIKYLTGIGDLIKNRMLLFDGLGTEFYYMEIEKNSNCPVCRNQA
jgi:adenylyltransferase/sulfurtransferase